MSDDAVDQALKVMALGTIQACIIEIHNTKIEGLELDQRSIAITRGAVIEQLEKLKAIVIAA